MKKKNQKVLDDLSHWKVTLNVEFWNFLTLPHYTNSQNSMILFDNSWFLAKNLSNFLSLPWKRHNNVCTISLCHSIMQPPLCWRQQEMRRTSAHSDSHPRLLNHLNQAFSNFVSLTWKLHNQHCHRGRVCPISLYHSIMQPPICWRQQEMRFLCYSQTMAARIAGEQKGNRAWECCSARSWWQQART